MNHNWYPEKYEKELSIAQIYLIFIIIPLYPFKSLRAGRIYIYNKKLWLSTFIISIIDLIIMFTIISRS